MGKIHAIKAVISERLPGGDFAMLEAYVPEDDKYSPVRFTDVYHANKMGLDKKEIHTPDGWVNSKDGVNFINNLWRAFHGNTLITCDLPVSGTVIAPSRPPRKAPRGEPSRDPMEDIEGQYRRFQQRENEL